MAAGAIPECLGKWWGRDLFMKKRKHTFSTSVLWAASALLLFAVPGFGQVKPPAPFELRDGDRVVFLGNSFFERALDYGHLETTLAVRWADLEITFRNLGWDGDTVYGHSRAGGRRRAVFGDPAEGYQKMVTQMNEMKPTVIFLAYGFNESFDGPEGLERFAKGLERLLTDVGNNETRWVLITPPAVEAKGRSVNAILGRYAEVILTTALAGGHHAVDLFETPGLKSPGGYENGLHLSAAGYRQVAGILAQQLKLPQPRLAPDSPQTEKIRQAIVKKNTLYFHRWRPRNDAFVAGERKDEQKTAQREPAQFEPLITKQEQLIRQLLKP